MLIAVAVDRIGRRLRLPTNVPLLVGVALLVDCGTQTPTATEPGAPAPSSLSERAPVELIPDLGDRQLFPRDNWWNRRVADAPVSVDSARMLSWIGRDVRLHPDFGPPPYGIPFVSVGTTQLRVPVDFVLFGDESDAGAADELGYPIPDEAQTQSNFIEGAAAGGGSSGDRHLLIVDRDRWLLYETWATRYRADTRVWEAGSGAVFDLNRNDRRPEGWTSADAAGLAVLPGLVRYEEAARGEIRHALRFTVRATNGYVWPASHRAGDTAGAPPMGMRLRLEASFDISGLPTMIRSIFQAMKDYGLILADNGSDMFVTGTMDPRWNNEELNSAFRRLRVGDFEVVELGWR